MSKTFKAKKQRRHLFKLRYIIFLGIMYLAFDTTYSFLLSRKATTDNEIYLKMILSGTNNHFVSSYKPKKILNNALSLLANIDISKPSSILGFDNFSDNTTPTTVEETHLDEYDFDKQEKITDYVKDPNPITVTNPIVYIYNSHQLENYDNKNLEIYNITPNVMMASYMLKEKLNDLGIQTIVNEFNLAEFIRINNWGHADSYKASRIFILDAKSQYSTLKYFIDIHRDSIKKDAGTIKIQGKNYAKTLFVVGQENPSYEQNLALANNLSNKINNKYPNLNRGVIKKQGAGVNGVYNQDISPNSMLIEIGGYQNNFEEVMNTVNALADILYEYIKGDI